MPRKSCGKQATRSPEWPFRNFCNGKGQLHHFYFFIFFLFFWFLLQWYHYWCEVWSVNSSFLFRFFDSLPFLFFSFLFLNRIEFMTSLHDNDPFMFHVSLHFLLQRIKVIKWKANNLGGLVVLIWLLMRNKNYETQLKFQCALK